MKRASSLTQQYISLLLLISLCLQSCDGLNNNLLIATGEEQIESIQTNTQLNIQPLADKKFSAQGGHVVTFYEEAGELKADIKMNVAQGFSKTYEGVEVLLEKGVELSNLPLLDKKAQERRIHLQPARGKQLPKVIIYKGAGMLGGMDGDSGEDTDYQEYGHSGEILINNESGETWFAPFNSEDDSDYDDESAQAQWEQGEKEADDQEQLSEALLRAIEAADLKNIKKHLRCIDNEHLLKSPSVDDKDRTFLHEAAEQDGAEVFEAVLGYWGEYPGREIEVQKEIKTIDADGETILSIAFRNSNWVLCDYLHNNLVKDTLEQLYQSLDGININSIAENLIDTKEGQKFLPYLLQYNYQLAENVADDDGKGKLEDQFRAKLYYLLSQWKDETGGDINQVIDSGGYYMEKAIELANDDADKKLYQAYQAALWLTSSGNEENYYDEAKNLADSASSIQAENVMASFLISYVKTVCALRKKDYEQYIKFYNEMIASFNLIPADAKNTLKNNLIDCFGDLETKHERKKIAEVLTDVVRSDYEGRVTKLFGNHNIQKRPYRPFKKEERLSQLLKQLATQLYFSAAKQNIKLVELQLMYCKFGGKRKLFIAANKLEDATKFFEYLYKLKPGELIELFTSDHKPSDTEGKERSKSYSKKLKRLFDNELNKRFNISEELAWVLEDVTNVITILKESMPQLLSLKYVRGNVELDKTSQNLIRETIVSGVDQLYLIIGECVTHRTRHAEEFLCDIFEYIKASGASSPFSCIGGKMRPCIGCSGRMISTGISKFNERPGKLWKNTIEHQPSYIAKKSLNILFDQPSFVSFPKAKEGKGKLKGIPSYDSGSESDLSDEEYNASDKKMSLPDAKEEDSSSGSGECDQAGFKKDKPTDKNRTKDPRVNVKQNGKEVSQVYWYEDNDIHKILTIEVNARNNKTVDGRPVCILGPLDNLSCYSLMSALKEYNRQRGIVLIPFNLGLSHWIGLIIEYDAYGKLIRADYYDSLGGVIPTYFTKILIAHNKAINNGSLLAFTRMQGNQLVSQENGSDCGPCTIANLLLNTHIGYQENTTISSVDRRFNHLQLLETSDPQFYTDFYNRQKDNRHSYLKLINYPEKGKTEGQLSPKEYKALSVIASNIASIQHLAKQFVEITAQSSNSSSNAQEHQITLTRLRSLLINKQSFKKDEHKIMDEVIKSIFHLDLESSLENAPLRLAYDHLVLLGEMVSSELKKRVLF
ncbi:MAG: Ulp1 family isopeptidase [Candidatus Amoebophilus sp.]